METYKITAAAFFCYIIYTIHITSFGWACWGNPWPSVPFPRSGSTCCWSDSRRGTACFSVCCFGGGRLGLSPTGTCGSHCCCWCCSSRGLCPPCCRQSSAFAWAADCRVGRQDQAWSWNCSLGAACDPLCQPYRRLGRHCRCGWSCARWKLRPFPAARRDPSSSESSKRTAQGALCRIQRECRPF